MHISEGVLSASVLAGGWALTVIGTTIGLKRVGHDKIMSVAILSSAFFVASLVHLPVGPGSVHLLLNGLMGLILGWACFPAILAALFLQAVFFQFGGIVVLGVNTFNMAVPALLCSCFLRP
ncbi:MAG: cobalt transporter CbiM, partial [Desulfobulbaceae bacterium]|nr:cobalt transporter CbiM [Desulfobulbaceae bacterium]